VIQQDEQEALAPPLYFNRRNPLYFSVFEATTLKKMVDPTLFTITVIYYDNYVQVEKEVGPCTLEDVVLDPKTFEALGYNSLYCIKNSTFVLSGYPDEPTFNFLEVMLFVCDNLTSNGTCKSPDEISAFFVGKVFSVGYQKSQINFHDYQNPFVVTYDIITNNIDPELIKSNSLYLKTAQVNTDDGWFFSNSHVQTNAMLDENLPDFSFRKNTFDPYVMWVIMASKETTICNRKYQRLPEVLGSLAGLFQTQIIICMVFTSLATHVSTLNHILNKLYYFEDQTSENLKTKKRKQRKKSPLDGSAISMNGLEQKAENNNFVTIELAQEQHPRISLPESSPLQTPFGPKNETQSKNNCLLSAETRRENQKTITTQNDMIENSEKVIMIKRTLINQNDLPQNLIEINEINSKKERDQNEIIEEKKNLANVCTNKEIIIPQAIDLILLRQKENKEIESNEGSFSLSCFEYLRYLCRKLCCSKKTDKEKLIEKAEEAFINELDVVHIVRKLQEIENLKLLMLEKDQMVLFNYITKPVITEKKEMRESTIVRRKLMNASYDQESVIMAYKNCKEEEKNIISMKLVEFLDKKWLKHSKK